MLTSQSIIISINYYIISDKIFVTTSKGIGITRYYTFILNEDLNIHINKNNGKA